MNISAAWMITKIIEDNKMKCPILIKLELQRIQEQLDQECLDMLPLIKEALNKSRNEGSENMRQITLIEAVNSHVKLVDMTKAELSDFQHGLLKMFNYHGWTK